MPLIVPWEFVKESKCFNCKKVAPQNIDMVPMETIVTCTNCGAERYYSIHSTFEGKEMPDFEKDGKKRKYDLWKFTRNDICMNCLKQADQEVIIDEFKAAAVCTSCLFTRIYKFNVYDIKK